MVLPEKVSYEPFHSAIITINYPAQTVISAEAENLSLVYLLLVYLSHNGSLIHIYTLNIQCPAHALCSKKICLLNWLIDFHTNLLWPWPTPCTGLSAHSLSRSSLLTAPHSIPPHSIPLCTLQAMMIEHRASCSKAENRASGLVDQAGLDEVKTTGREKAWASWEQGQTTRQMGQLDWLQLEAQSWLVFKSSTCLLFNYWTVSVRFQGCRNLLFLLLKQHCMMNTFSKNGVTAHLFLCAFATEFTRIIVSLFYMIVQGWVNSQQFQEWNVHKDFQDCDTTGFGNSKSLLSKTCFLIWCIIAFHVLCTCYNLCSNSVMHTWSWATLTDNEGFRGLLDFWSQKLAGLTNSPMTSPLNSFRTLGWMPSCPCDLSTSSLSTRSRKFCDLLLFDPVPLLLRMI